MGNIITQGTTASSPVGATTTTDLIDRTRHYLGQYGGAFTDMELLTALNEGVSDLFTDLDAIPLTTTVTLVGDQANYNLPSGITTVEEVILDSTDIPLTPITPSEAQRIDWDDSTTVSHYTSDFITSAGVRRLRLYPTPSSSVSDSVSVLYYGSQDDLDTVDTDPTWHRKFHFLVCHFAASVLHVERSRKEFHEQRYIAGKNEYRRWLVRARPPRFERARMKPLGRSLDSERRLPSDYYVTHRR